MESESSKNRDNCDNPISSSKGYVNRPNSQVNDIAELIMAIKILVIVVVETVF